jgi:hypothetical protein
MVICAVRTVSEMLVLCLTRGKVVGVPRALRVEAVLSSVPTAVSLCRGIKRKRLRGEYPLWILLWLRSFASEALTFLLL